MPPESRITQLEAENAALREQVDALSAQVRGQQTSYPAPYGYAWPVPMLPAASAARRSLPAREVWKRLGIACGLGTLALLPFDLLLLVGPLLASVLSNSAGDFLVAQFSLLTDVLPFVPVVVAAVVALALDPRVRHGGAGLWSGLAGLGVLFLLGGLVIVGHLMYPASPNLTGSDAIPGFDVIFGEFVFTALEALVMASLVAFAVGRHEPGVSGTSVLWLGPCYGIAALAGIVLQVMGISGFGLLTAACSDVCAGGPLGSPDALIGGLLFMDAVVIIVASIIALPAVALGGLIGAALRSWLPRLFAGR